MLVDFKIEFHKMNAFVQNTVNGFNLYEQLTGPQVTFKLSNLGLRIFVIINS